MWQDRWFAFGVRPGTVSASVAAWLGALLSSLCCLLPLAVIVLGLGSGAFMAVTMYYRWLLIPADVRGGAPPGQGEGAGDGPKDRSGRRGTGFHADPTAAPPSHTPPIPPPPLPRPLPA